MKNFFSLTLLFTLACISFQKSSAQKCPVNFDKISAADFEIDPKTVDTSYGAVILADVGKSSFEANKKGFFSIIYKFQRRVKVLNAKAFDLATVKIPLYKSPKTDMEEILESLSATTYNLVNGKVEETKLDKSNVFKEVVDKKRVIKKFTMPAVKEGSIIDISYTIHSDFLFNLQPWSFQGNYPRLWSEYNLNLPEFFEYVFLAKGDNNFLVKESKNKFQSYVVRIAAETVSGSDDLISLSSNNTIVRWVKKDVPALKEESYTSSMDNYTSRIEFQMTGQQFPNMPHRDIMGSWGKASVELLKDNEFGAAFTETNTWADNYLNTLNLNKKDTLAMAKAIYYALQKSISSSGGNGIYTSQPLKETFNTKKGYVPDINLLLTLLLKQAGLDAYPMLLSTKSNGVVNDRYPILSQYNYVIAKLETRAGHFYLDASKSHLSFGTLPYYCYNGNGAIIDIMPGSEKLLADTLLEKKVTNLILFNNESNKNEWVGTLSTMPGYYEALSIKDDIKEKGKPAFDKKIIDEYSGEYSAEKVELKNDADNEKSLQLKYSVKIERDENAGIIYFNPMMKEGMKENFFKNPERKYPVEMPYRIDETYTLLVQIPDGYVLDETPKSTRVTLNETDGNFEYIVAKSDKDVSLRTQLKLNKTFFAEDEYEALRGFLDYVVKKHAEQIVFKKK